MYDKSPEKTSTWYFNLKIFTFPLNTCVHITYGTVHVCTYLMYVHTVHVPVMYFRSIRFCKGSAQPSPTAAAQRVVDTWYLLGKGTGAVGNKTKPNQTWQNCQ